MVKINKFTIGVRPASKMFRILSLGGLLIDTVLAERGTKSLEKEYYSEVSSNIEQGFFQLKNEELGNTLRFDLSNVIFFKDVYDDTEEIDLGKALNEFTVIWQSVNEILKLRDIRRLGIVAEHQIKLNSSNVNVDLLKSLTSLKPPRHPGKFHLTYEERRPTQEALAPDMKKDDLINVIYHFYDGEIDAEHSNPGTINANIDLQRYYSPLLSSNIPDEVKKLYKTFLNEKNKFDEFLREKKVIQ